MNLDAVVILDGAGSDVACASGWSHPAGVGTRSRHREGADRACGTEDGET
jgi:hypothetical protein